MSIRRPAVAGMFYEADPKALRSEIEACFLADGGAGSLVAPQAAPRRIVGLVSPHAGYLYSGTVAAYGYHRLAQDGVPGTVIILGVSHRPHSAMVVISADEGWRTPLGDIAVNRDVAERIAAEYTPAAIDSGPHMFEHSIEVQVPFLQYIAEQHGVDFRIVPIVVVATVYDPDALDISRQLGRAIADAVRDTDAVVVASTDFTHYESQETARRKDSQAIARILDLDEKGLIDTVRDQDISMCGAMPTAISVTASKELGATSARELAYRTSGDVTGDYVQVVGYASIEIDR